MKKQKDNEFASRIADASAAVIAGGKSTRFGSPKANALLEDKHLIDYAIQIAYRLSREVFLVTARNIPIEHSFAPSIPDIIPDCGPLGGILTALVHSSNPYVCTLPCDMPMMSPKVFSILTRYKSKTRPVVARSEQGLEPLLAIWPADVWTFLYQNIHHDRLSIRHTLDELKAVEIDISNQLPQYTPELFTNINYREDLNRIAALRPAM